MTHTDAAQKTDRTELQTDQQADALVSEDLIEEVSIDGMCGVY